MDSQAFDYIVIGGGTSGCIVAARLSEDPGARVLLLEAGPTDSRPEIHDPAQVHKLWGSEVDWATMSEPQPGLNGRQLLLNHGKVIGGGSAIHAMIHIRGNPRDFDTWNYLGNEGWSYRDVLPYFRKSEDYAGGASEYHGAGGPISVVDLPNPTPAARAFVAAARELGYDGGPDFDFNGPGHENAGGLYQFTMTRDGKRASAATAFLNPHLARPNLSVVTDALVARLVMEGTQCVGVEYRRGGATEVAQAAREVVVCAGAHDSPKILMLSGIGPAAQLAKHGVACVHDLAGVGQNLQDHLRMPVLFRCPQEQPMPITLAEAGLLIRTRPGIEAAAPDLQINFNAAIPHLMPPDFPGNPRLSVTFMSILAQPESRGEVRLRSANPEEQPVVDPHYLECESDIDVQVAGIRLCRRIVGSPAFAPFRGAEVIPGENADEAALRDYVRNNVFTIWHPVGTCRMGHDRMAVVDPQLRVHGIRGLRVADASVMPRIVSSNTNAAVMMIAEKAADMIRAARTA